MKRRCDACGELQCNCANTDAEAGCSLVFWFFMLLGLTFTIISAVLLLR